MIVKPCYSEIGQVFPLDNLKQIFALYPDSEQTLMLIALQRSSKYQFHSTFVLGFTWTGIEPMIYIHIVVITRALSHFAVSVQIYV